MIRQENGMNSKINLKINLFNWNWMNFQKFKLLKNNPNNQLV